MNGLHGVSFVFPSDNMQSRFAMCPPAPHILTLFQCRQVFYKPMQVPPYITSPGGRLGWSAWAVAWGSSTRESYYVHFKPETKLGDEHVLSSIFFNCFFFLIKTDSPRPSLLRPLRQFFLYKKSCRIPKPRNTPGTYTFF